MHSFWFRRADTAAGHIWSICENTGAGDDEWIGSRMASTTTILMQRKQGNVQNITISGTISDTTWNHGYWSFGGTTSDEGRGALNGGGLSSNAGNKNPSDLKVTLVGGAKDTADAFATTWKGDFAEWAIWDLELTWAALNSGATNPDDVPGTTSDRAMKNALADGASPLYFPAGLISYWRFDEKTGDVHDMMRRGNNALTGPNHLTEVGTCASVDHPRIYYPGKVYSFSQTVAAGGLSIVRFGNDTVNIADAVQPLLGLLRFGSDTVNIADAVIAAQAMARVLGTTVELADAEVAARAMVRLVDEAEEVADGVLSVLGIVRALGTIVEVADAAPQHQLELLRFGDDTEDIADDVTRPMSLTRFDDTVEEVADGVIRPMDMVRVFDTVEQVADTSTDSLGLIRFGDDDVDIADGILPILGIVRFADDTLNIADAAQNQLELLRFADDTVNVSDAIARARAMVRVLDATLNITDVEVRRMALTRALGDTVEVADELLYLLGLIRFTPDSIELADALQRTFGLIRAINETEQITDAALEKVTPVVGLGPQFSNAVEEIADGAIFSRVMVRSAPADVEEIATATLAQLGLLGQVDATVNLAETLVPVCKPVASFGVLKIYDGTQWVAGPEFFAS